jgi:hypothetical protein
MRVVLVVAVLLAGCGSDNSPSRDAASSSSTVEVGNLGGGVLVSSADPSRFSPQKVAFVAAAKTICDNSAAQIGAAYQAGLTQSSSPDQIIAFTRDTYVPMYQARLDALSALTPPPEDSDRIRQLIADSRDALAKLSASPMDYTAVDPFAGVDIGFDTYGLTACGSRTG